MWKYQNTDELYHTGVLGMKWGHRKYQNSDGTLNELGMKKNKNGKIDKKLGKKLNRKVNKLLKNKKSLTYKTTQYGINEKINSKEYKDLIEYTNKNGTIFDANDKKFKIVEKLMDNYNKKEADINNKYAKKISSSVLKDLNYEDTKAGRDYVHKILNDLN